jgi:lysophospholipase L1-like esterase
MRSSRSFPAAVCACALLALLAACTSAPARFDSATTRYDFGAGPVAKGSLAVRPDTLYTPARGYGLVGASGVHAVAGPGRDARASDALTSEKPFSFVVDLPEGNYDVTVLFGDPGAASVNTVKAESRRLMLERVQTVAGATTARTFTVNIRQPEIGATGRRVALKDRERGVAHWDDKLSLEFNGAHAAVAGLDIRRNDSALTVYLAGDSTVTDQPAEPWSAWGAMLPRFFPAGVAVANHAESGLSLASFKGGARLDKILSTLRRGDYVFIQFGHNDQKEKGENVGAFTTYSASLRAYVDAIQAAGGNPVLVTPMYRRRFNGDKLFETLGDYPEAVRRVAAEKKVPCIDLHAMSGRFFSALGPEKSVLAVVHFPAGAYGSAKAVNDDTHFCAYGAYELARCMVEGIRAEVPALAARLAPDAGRFDPDHPDDPAAFAIPASAAPEEVRIPDGDGR